MAEDELCFSFFFELNDFVFWACVQIRRIIFRRVISWILRINTSITNNFIFPLVRMFLVFYSPPPPLNFEYIVGTYS